MLMLITCNLPKSSSEILSIFMNQFNRSLRTHTFHHFLNIWKNSVIAASEMRDRSVLGSLAVPVRNEYPFYRLSIVLSAGMNSMSDAAV
jgi:hypothetical protein